MDVHAHTYTCIHVCVIELVEEKRLFEGERLEQGLEWLEEKRGKGESEGFHFN